MKFAALVFAVLLAGCSLAINVPPTPTSRLPQLTPTPALLEPTATTSPKPLRSRPGVS